MNSSGGAFFALFLFLQLVTAVAVLLGGIYALYCLHRMNENINRLADIAEAWIIQQQHQAANVPPAPMPVVGRVEHVVAPPAPQPVIAPAVPSNPHPLVDNESKF